MPRPYIAFPDPRLRSKADEVGAIDDAIRAIWDEMLQAMYAMPGVGLAAPQLGIGLRLAVLDCSETRDQPVRLANPVIVALSEETQTISEGSPNLPGLYEKVTRPARATIRYTTDAGDEIEQVFAGLWATSVQHQIDHLDGLLFIDRLGPMRRRRILDQHRKQARGRARKGA